MRERSPRERIQRRRPRVVDAFVLGKARRCVGDGDAERVERRIGAHQQADDVLQPLNLSEVEKAYPIYTRFLRAKAKMLSLTSDFSVWDTGAPLGKSDKDFTFEEAYDLHLSVMKDFDPDFYDYSKRMIEEERIDVFPRAGKRG